jgi:hypothetical protein
MFCLRLAIQECKLCVGYVGWSYYDGVIFCVLRVPVIWKLYNVCWGVCYLWTVFKLTGALNQARLRQLTKQMCSCMSRHLHESFTRHCEGWMLVVSVVGPVGHEYGVIQIPQESVLEVEKASTQWNPKLTFANDDTRTPKISPQDHVFYQVRCCRNWM